MVNPCHTSAQICICLFRQSNMRIVLTINSKYNEIEIILILLSQLCAFPVQPHHSSLLGLYGPVLLCLLGNMEKYSPSCQSNTETQLFHYCLSMKEDTGSIIFRNQQCLYQDSSWDVR